MTRACCKLSIKSKDLDAKFISAFSDVMPHLRIKYRAVSDLKKAFSLRINLTPQASKSRKSFKNLNWKD